MASHTFLLGFRDLSLWIHLGVLPGEQNQPQEVRISIEIELAAQPGAMESDKIADTISYSDLVTSFRADCEKKHFKTIEHLARDIMAGISRFTPAHLIRRLTVRKVNPPIVGLLGGAYFEIRQER